MRIDPEIAALRSDPAAQRRAQESMMAAGRNWKSVPRMTPLLQQFSRYAAGDALEALGDLHELVTDLDVARQFVASCCDFHIDALQASPLAQISFRHSYSKGFATIQLLTESGASLALAVYAQNQRSVEPESVTFSDREQHEIAIAGAASGILANCADAGQRPSTKPIAFKPGDALRLDCNIEMRQWVDVKSRLVLLQLSRVAYNPAPTREIRISDGALLLQSDGDKRASQASIALAVLGAMERRDALPVMEQSARSGPPHLRWEAVRQIITLDPFCGLALLDEMAQETSGELAQPARRLAAQLRKAHPALRKERAA